MKKMISRFIGVCIIILAQSACAQSVKGKIDIKYNSRVQLDETGSPQKGIKDVYLLDLDMDLVSFKGRVEHQPGIYSETFGVEKQASEIIYNLIASIRNPANLEQTKAIGKIVGSVPVDKKGVYRFDDGSLRMAIDGAGSASGFESKFSGLAVGKPIQKESLVDKMKKQAVTLTRQVKGKSVKIVVSDYDRMNFVDLMLASGPVRVYPETKVNGEMLYDYERSAWYFNGVTLNYQLGGKAVTDKLSGNIKWVESPQRATNGEGEYQFDIRVNEPEKTGEAEVFAGGDDEAAFFTTDSTIPSLTGTAKYKDTMRGESVVASVVMVDLVGNNLSKQQVMALTKLTWFVSIVPLNAE